MDEKKPVPERAEQEKEKKRKPNKRLTRILTAILTLLLVALAVLVFVFRYELNGEGLRKMFGRSNTIPEQSEAFTYEAGNGQVFAAAGDGLAVASSSAIQLLDADGETVWKQVVSYGTPAVFASAERALFCDIGSTGCAAAGQNGESWALTPAGDIISADMNENGWFLLVTDEAGYKGLVSVYNSSCELQYEWWSGSGYVLKACISPDNRLLAVLCAEKNGGKLHFFSLDSDTEKAAVEFTGELPFDLAFMGSDTVCAVSGEGLRFVSADGTVKGEYRLGDAYLLDYDLGSQNFAAIFVSAYRTGTGGVIDTILPDGTLLGYVETERNVSSLSACGKRLLVMTSGDLSVYGQDMTQQYTNEALMTAKKAILRPAGDILLLSAYSAERLSF